MIILLLSLFEMYVFLIRIIKLLLYKEEKLFNNYNVFF